MTPNEPTSFNPELNKNSLWVPIKAVHIELKTKSVDSNRGGSTNLRMNVETATDKVWIQWQLSAFRIWKEGNMKPFGQSVKVTPKIGQLCNLASSLESSAFNLVGLYKERPEKIVDKQEANQELFQPLTEDEKCLPPEELIRRASISPQFSKALVKHLSTLEDEQLTPLTKALENDLPGLIKNENTCYLVKYIVKSSASLAKRCGILSVSLEQVFTQQHTSRLVFTLCNHSEKFRDLLIASYKSRMKKFVSHLSGAILLSLLINNAEDIGRCKFVLEELRVDRELIKMRYFSRALATYMHRCSQEVLSEIALLLKKSIVYLLHDNYGNYLLQIFYERANGAGMEVCQAALLKIYRKAFVRKYSRFVLLKAVQFGEGEFIGKLLDAVCNDRSTLLTVAQKKVSTAIFFLALAKCQFGLENYLRKVRAFESNMRSDSCWQDQEHFTSHLRKFDFIMDSLP